MRKFLIVSALWLVSLMANASYTVTTNSDGSVTITVSDGGIESIEADKQQAIQKYTSVNIGTEGTYELTDEDLKKLMGGCEYKDDTQHDKECLLSIKTTNMDFSESHISTEAMDKGKFGRYVGSVMHLSSVTLSKYNNVPDNCFAPNLNGQYLERVTVPDGGTEKTIGMQAFQAMPKLQYLYIGDNVTEIGENLCGWGEANKSVLASVVFKSTKLTEIPKMAFQKCTNLAKVELPSEGLKTIGENAFDDCQNLEAIHLPRTLETIKQNAFLSCGLRYIVIPANVKSIESFAFQDNNELVGVYLQGNSTKCSPNGFSNELTNHKFSNNKETDENNPCTSNEDWSNGNGGHPLVLHYPGAGNKNKESVSYQNYTNEYTKLLNDDEALEALKSVNSADDKTKFLKTFSQYHLKDGEFPEDLWKWVKDNTQECPFVWYQYTDNDGKTQKMRLWKSEDGKGYWTLENENADYNGWKQFMIAQADVQQTTHEDPRMIEDKWYSMCFPVDLTDLQLATAYGWGTEICEFDGVFKMTQEADDTHATPQEYHEFRFHSHPNGISIISQNEIANNEISSSTYAAGTVVVKANTPYMIHPASKNVDENGNLVARIIPDVPQSSWKPDNKNLIPVIPTSDADNFIPGYEFIGSYTEKGDIPANSWYFGYKSNGTFALNHSTNGKKASWPAYSSLIKYNGTEPETLNAKNCRFQIFNKSKDNTTTGINEVNLNPSTPAATMSHKIFNLNGQVVKEGNDLSGLSKGIYIMNGKKYIVK